MSQLKKIQYNCKKATFLIEKKMLSRITFREHIELRIPLQIKFTLQYSQLLLVIPAK